MNNSERDLIRTQAVCRHLVKNTHMAMTLLASGYGLFENTSGSLLELFGYSGAIYEFAAIPYADDASKFIHIAIPLIGKAIEMDGIDPEISEFTFMTENFGPNLSQYRSVLEVPFQFNSDAGKREEFMMTRLRSYRSEIASCMEIYSRSPRVILGNIARNVMHVLSTRLYGKYIISDEFFKNNYAFLQEVIEQQSLQDRRMFGISR